MKDKIGVKKEKSGHSSANAESFKYRLEMLRMEVELIDRIIARFDQYTQTTKNWAIVIWAGSIALSLSSVDLRKYIILTAILPLLFWFIDAWWRRLQKRSILRQSKIEKFLNSERFVDSFRQKKLIDDFKVLDPIGRQYRGTSEYKSSIKFWRIIKYREISIFYGGLMLISIALGLFFMLKT